MPSPVFFLHESEWRQIEVLPVENRIRCQGMMTDLRAFTRTQKAGRQADRAFVLPDVQQDCRLSEREIRVVELSERLEESFVPAPLVQSGSSTSLQTLCNAFAFGAASGRRGAFYGIEQEGIVFALSLILPHSDDPDILATFATALALLAKTHDLFVLDWSCKRAVSVRDPASVLRYLQGTG